VGESKVEKAKEKKTTRWGVMQRTKIWGGKQYGLEADTITPGFGQASVTIGREKKDLKE